MISIETPKQFTAKQVEFVNQYFLCGKNASEAYRRAGYKSKNPDVDAAKLLVNPSISTAIKAEEVKLQAKHEITRDTIVQELAAIAFGNIADIVDWGSDSYRVKTKTELTYPQQKFIEKIQFKIDVGGSQTISINTLAKEKIKAIEVLSKLLGFDQQQDHSADLKKSFADALLELDKEEQKNKNVNSF